MESKVTERSMEGRFSASYFLLLGAPVPVRVNPPLRVDPQIISLLCWTGKDAELNPSSHLFLALFLSLRLVNASASVAHSHKCVYGRRDGRFLTLAA